jgi:hypothetical protein
VTNGLRGPEPSAASETHSPSSHIEAVATASPSSASGSSSVTGTHLGQICSSAD